MNPEIQRLQATWDAYAEFYGTRKALADLGPRPEVEPEQVGGLGRQALTGLTDAMKGLGLGAGEAVVSTMAGAAGLADRLVPGQGPATRAHDQLSRTRGRLEEATPDSGAGQVGRGVGRLGTELATAIAPGAGVVKLGRGLGVAKKALPWMGVGTDMAVDAAIEAGQRPEDSLASFLGLDVSAESDLGRASVGAATAGALGTVFEGVRATRGFRADRIAKREEELAAVAAASTKEDLLHLADRARLSHLPPRGPNDSVSLLKGAGDHPTARGLARDLKAEGMDPKRATPWEPDTAPRFRRPEAIGADLDARAAALQDLDGKVALMSPASPTYRSALRQREVEEAFMRNEIHEYFGGLTEAARSMVYHRWRTEGTKTLTGLNAFVKRTLGDSLTFSQMEEIKQFVKFNSDGETLASIDTSGLAQWIQQSREPLSWGNIQYWTDMIRSGMLSALYSVNRAVFGNTSSVAAQALGAPARVLTDGIVQYFVRRAAGLEDVVGEFSRTSTFRGEASALRAAGRGFVEGTKDAPDIMVKGFVDTDFFGQAMSIEKLELHARRLESGFYIGKHDVGNAWAQLWFRLQSAVDTPFRKSVANHSIVKQAHEIATRMENLKPEAIARYLRRQGLDPKSAQALAGRAVDARIEHLVATPTPAMMGRAMEEAQFAAFQNDTALNRWIQAARQAARSKPNAVGKEAAGEAVRGLVDLTIPFARTPSAIATRVVETGPVGWVRDVFDGFRLIKEATVIREAHHAGRKVDYDAAMDAFERTRRQLARRVGDQAAATTLVAGLGFSVGWDALFEGRVTGGMPSNAQERSQFLREGKIPYGVRIGDRWYSLAQLPPVGHMFAMGAVMAEWALERDEMLRRAEAERPGVMDLVQDLGVTSMDIMMESPFFQGVQRVSDVSQSKENPHFARRAVASYAGSAVPNLLATMARADDPIRLKRNETLGASAKDAVLERLPGFSRNLPGRRDRVTGDVLTRENSRAARILSLIDPFGSSPDRLAEDPVLRALGESKAQPSDLGRLPGEDTRGLNERLEAEGPYVRQVLEAFVEPNPDPARLRAIGVDLADVREYQRLTRMGDSREVQEAKAEILKAVISRARRNLTGARNFVARGGAGG
jgi:hypothetical protein